MEECFVVYGIVEIGEFASDLADNEIEATISIPEAGLGKKLFHDH